MFTMTEERRQELEEKLNKAEAHGDEAEISAIRKTMNQEYRLCTAHTAERMKRIEKTVNAIEQGLIPAEMFTSMQSAISSISQSVAALKADIEKWKNKAEGAKMLWKILGYIAAAGGSGAVFKFLLVEPKF
jgi:protein subunit release factor A